MEVVTVEGEKAVCEAIAVRDRLFNIIADRCDAPSKIIVGSVFGDLKEDGKFGADIVDLPNDGSGGNFVSYFRQNRNQPDFQVGGLHHEEADFPRYVRAVEKALDRLIIHVRTLQRQRPGKGRRGSSSPVENPSRAEAREG
ncbi:MAG: hypothetical protein ABIK36_09320 [Pseudomonadota bacterium]